MTIRKLQATDQPHCSGTGGTGSASEGHRAKGVLHRVLGLARLAEGQALLHTRCGEVLGLVDVAFSYTSATPRNLRRDKTLWFPPKHLVLNMRQVLWNIDSPADERVGQAVLISHWEFEDGTRGGPGAPVNEGELEPAGDQHLHSQHK